MRQSLLIVFPLFLVIGAGFGLRYFGFLRRTDVDLMNRLTFYIALPLLLIVSMAGSQAQELAFGNTVLIYFLASVPVVVAVYAATHRMPQGYRGAVLISSFRGNLAYVGVPVVASALGPGALARAAVAVGILTIIVQVISVVILERLRSRPHPVSVLRQALEILLNPLILGCALGLALRSLPAGLPALLARPMEMVGQLALPLALLTLGASMVGSIRRSTVLGAGAAALVKVIIHPTLGWLIGQFFFRLSPADMSLAVIMLACPTAIVSFSVVKELDGDAPLCASAITLSTLLSLVTLTGWLAILPR
jgi:predicted permease